MQGSTMKADMSQHKRVIEQASLVKINLLLNERKGHTVEYWLETVAAQTSLCLVCTKTTQGQYSASKLG